MNKTLDFNWILMFFDLFLEINQENLDLIEELAFLILKNNS